MGTEEHLKLRRGKEAGKGLNIGRMKNERLGEEEEADLLG